MVKLPYLPLLVVRQDPASEYLGASSELFSVTATRCTALDYVQVSSCIVPVTTTVATSNLVGTLSKPISTTIGISTTLLESSSRSGGHKHTRNGYSAPTSSARTAQDHSCAGKGASLNPCATTGSIPVAEIISTTTSVTYEYTTVRSVLSSTLFTIVTVGPPPATSRTSTFIPTSISHAGQTTTKPRAGNPKTKKSRHRHETSSRTSSKRRKSPVSHHPSPNTYTPYSSQQQTEHVSTNTPTSTPSTKTTTDITSRYETSYSSHSIRTTDKPKSASSDPQLRSRSTSTPSTTTKVSSSHSTTSKKQYTLHTAYSSTTHITSHRTSSTNAPQKSDQQLPTTESNSNTSKIYIGVFSTVGSVIGIFIIGCILFALRRKKKLEFECRGRRKEKRNYMPEISRPILPPSQFVYTAYLQREPPQPPIPPRAPSRPSPPLGPLRVVNGRPGSGSDVSGWSPSLDEHGQRRWSNPFDME